MELNKNSVFLKLFGAIRCIILRGYYVFSLSSEGLFFVGKGIKFFINKGKVKFGKRVRLSDFVHIQSSGILEIGNHTTVNSYSRIIAFNKIVIGSNCAIAAFVTILDHDHEFHLKGGRLNFDGYQEQSIRIGSNVWIGDKVTILKGVSIGDNVVIGASSLVKDDIPSNCVACGNPCKVIRYLC